MSDELKDEETALVPRQPLRMTRSFSLLPGSLGEAREIAGIIAKSAFAPKDYKDNPDAVLIAIQMGADVGLAPMQALQNIAVINGRPSVWGDAALALCMPALERFHETFEGDPKTDTYTAVCTVKRKGLPDEIVRSFSILDAKRAKLWDKNNTPWQTYPQRMLQMRARSWALRDACADRLMGLILAEEAMDVPVERHVGSGTVVESQEVVEPYSVQTLRECEPTLIAAIEKGFITLNMGNGAKLAKLNEFFAREAIEATSPAACGEKLLRWLKDEYALRLTGKRPLEGKSGNQKEPKTEAGKPDAPQPVGHPGGASTGPAQPDAEPGDPGGAAGEPAGSVGSAPPAGAKPGGGGRGKKAKATEPAAAEPERREPAPSEVTPSKPAEEETLF